MYPYIVYLAFRWCFTKALLDIDKRKVRQNKAILGRDSAKIESVLFTSGKESPGKTELWKRYTKNVLFEKK